MGLFDWLFGGDRKEEPMRMGAGTHQMQSSSAPMSGADAAGGMHMQHSESTPGVKVAKDPVCGMDVNPEEAAATSIYQGTTYYFCAPGCKASFEMNPSKYLSGSGQTKESMHGSKHGGCC